MGELKVSRWRKPGHDRWYVNLPDGTAVAWADVRTGKVTILVEERRAEAVAALRAHFADQPKAPEDPVKSPKLQSPPRPERARPRVVAELPALTKENDLARNRPGSEVRDLLAAQGPKPVQRVVNRLLRRKNRWDSWSRGLAGERKTGAELGRLTRHGWKVLHSIRLSRGGDVDHLLIGPGGVFTINTKYLQGKSVWIGDDVVKVDHGPARPYPAKSRAEAKYVRGVLERYCAFPVPVEPVLVFVGAQDLPRVPTQLGVRIYREREVSVLGPLTGKLTQEQVEAVYAVARHRGAWLGS